MIDTMDLTISSAFHASAQRHPDKVALCDRSSAYTYRDLEGAVSTTAESIRRLGARPGDRVSVMLDNHTDHVIVTLALAELGIIEVPINTAYHGTILRRMLSDCTPVLVVSEERYVDLLKEAGADVPLLTRSERPGSVLGEGWGAAPLVGEALTGTSTPARASDPCSIIYTSGTTGFSKGVLTSHAQAVAFSTEVPWVTSDDVVMVVLPLFHIGGKWAGAFGALFNGATAVLLERFSVSRFWDDTREFGCTQAMLLGSMPLFLMNAPPSPQDREHTLRRVVFAPITPLAADFADRFGLQVATCYALTEGCNPIYTPYGETEPGYAGFVRDGFEVAVVDPYDCEVPAGDLGELVIRPTRPFLTMLEYWGNPEATKTTWRNLWLHTGDFARHHEDGRFEFSGRSSDVLRRRGENISAFEVENIVDQHAQVLESAVVAVKQADGEDEVMCVVVPSGPRALVEGDLIEYLQDHLPYFMVPRFVQIVDELPKTPTGKVSKLGLGTLVPPPWDAQDHGFVISGKENSRG